MTTFPILPVRAQGLERLSDILQLIADQRGGDITSPDGLRRAIEFVSEIAALMGMDEGFIERVRKILADEQVFQVVLSIVQYLGGVLRTAGGPRDSRIRFEAIDDSHGTIIESEDFLEWLPVVLQTLELIQRLLDLAQGRN